MEGGRETIAVDHEEEDRRQAELSGSPSVRFHYAAVSGSPVVVGSQD